MRKPLMLLCLILTTTLATADDWRSKVDPWVLDTARAGTTEFLVMLSDQADLSAARGLATKEAKGSFVHETLSGHAARTQGPILAELRSRGVEHRSYWVANMIWVSGGADIVEAMARRGDVLHVYANPWVRLDGPVAVAGEAPEGDRAVEWNIVKVKADQVWAAGTDGSGAVIAGQDTGYLWTHDALVNQYRGGPGGNHDYNWHDAIHVGGSSCGADSPQPCDDHDHGTHTMGTMVGDDGGSNQIGMAPGAEWIGCRNMNAGAGTPTTYAECYQWFIAPTKVDGTAPDPSKAPHVINNSWGCPPSEGCTDPNVLLTVVQNVRAAGIVTVHSAGNSGSSCSTVEDPAAIYGESFSVGASDSSDGIASFSSRGPVTIDGSNRLKPDITAPGVSIRSSVSSGGYEGGFWSGTSMAGPHVAGLVALLISREPSLAGQVDLIEEIIRATAVPLTTSQGCGGDASNAVPNNVFGWGRIDALAAHQYPLDYSLTAPPVVAACASQAAEVDVVVSGMGTFAEPVTLSVSGLPAGVTHGWSPNPVTPSGTGRLTLDNLAAAVPGTHPLEVSGSSSPTGVVRAVALDLELSAGAAGTPTPTAPADGALSQSTRPTFTWTAGSPAGAVRLDVARDVAFTDVVYTADDLAGTEHVPDTDLPTNSQLHWRLVAANGCGSSAPSTTWSFTTEALPGDCGAGTEPDLALFVDFEAGVGDWTHSGTGDSWALSGTRVHSGAAAFHADDPTGASDQRLVSPEVALPAVTPLTLQFWDWQQIEDSPSGCYDGGLVEVSTDGGTSWTPIPGGALLTVPYDGPTTGLGGLDGWCSDLDAAATSWRRVVVDLAAWAGDSVRFRFRLGSDTSVGREGWYVDDVAVQACTAVATDEVFSDGFEGGGTAMWSSTVP